MTRPEDYGCLTAEQTRAVIESVRDFHFDDPPYDEIAAALRWAHRLAVGAMILDGITAGEFRYAGLGDNGEPLVANVLCPSCFAPRAYPRHAHAEGCCA